MNSIARILASQRVTQCILQPASTSNLREVVLAFRSASKENFSAQPTRKPQASASATAPHHYIALFYKYDAKDMAELLAKRLPLRPSHLAHALAAKSAGKLAMGGAWGEECKPGGMLLFRDSSKEQVEEFARADPYVTGKLVSGWSVKPWTVVIDSLTSEPEASLFVGNLPFTATSREVMEIFKQAGFEPTYTEVKSGRTLKSRVEGKSRGWATVRFATLETATKAVAATNGAVIGGRTIAVRIVEKA